MEKIDEIDKIILYDQFIRVTMDKIDEIDKICCTSNL